MANPKRILIVDDEESIGLLLRRILESNPALELTLATGGEEALKLAAERSYDLILLDLLMGEVGGIEVLTRLRSGQVNKKTPVIIVSVLADAHTKMACQSLGVSGYLVKPIDREAVIDAVNGAVAS
jgi:CheY-like chemotaxis protein